MSKEYTEIPPEYTVTLNINEYYGEEEYNFTNQEYCTEGKEILAPGEYILSDKYKSQRESEELKHESRRSQMLKAIILQGSAVAISALAISSLFK